MNTLPEVRRVVRLYYGFQFFFSLLLWIPVFYEYQKRIGLNDTEIFRIQSIYYIAFCLLEVPTGLLADTIGARMCMRLGSFVVVLSGLYPIFSQNYDGFLIHFLLIALARSLVSGAANAYIYEFLKSNAALGIYKRVEGNARGFGLIGKVVLWGGIGSLMQWHLTAPYWATLFLTSISMVYAWSLPAVAVQTERGAAFSLGNLAKLGGMLKDSPLLVLIMFQGISLFVLDRILALNLFQPILAQKGFELAAYGAVMSFMTVFETFGSLSPGFIKLERRWMSDLNAIFCLTLGLAAILLWLDHAGKWGTVAGLGAFAFCTGLAYPIQRSLMNGAIPDSRYRATLLSVESIADRAVNALVATQIGVFVASGRLGEFLRISAGVSIAAMILLFAGIKMLQAKTAARQN